MLRPRRSNSSRAKRQQKYRLRRSLFKSAHKFGVECDADVCVILRTRKDGRTFTFNTDSFEKFLPLIAELDHYYPTPMKTTPKDFTTEAKDSLCSQNQKCQKTSEDNQNGIILDDSFAKTER